MKLISMLAALAVIFAVVWFLFFRKSAPAAAPEGASVSETSGRHADHRAARDPLPDEPAGHATTTLGRAKEYSTTTVQNAYDTQNAAIDAAMQQQ